MTLLCKRHHLCFPFSLLYKLSYEIKSAYTTLLLEVFFHFTLHYGGSQFLSVKRQWCWGDLCSPERAFWGGSCTLCPAVGCVRSSHSRDRGPRAGPWLAAPLAAQAACPLCLLETHSLPPCLEPWLRPWSLEQMMPKGECFPSAFPEDHGSSTHNLKRCLKLRNRFQKRSSPS